MSDGGVVEAIHVAPSAGAPMVSLASVRAIAGRGLEGDRYAAGTGHWSPMRRAGDGLTLIEAEEVERIAAAHDLDPKSAFTRRNVTTRGVRLDGLIGRRFRIGTALLRGVRRCEPCSYLDQLLGRSVLIDLVHRGGIRVEIEEGGTIAVGDRIEPIDG